MGAVSIAAAMVGFAAAVSFFWRTQGFRGEKARGFRYAAIALTLLSLAMTALDLRLLQPYLISVFDPRFHIHLYWRPATAGIVLGILVSAVMGYFQPPPNDSP